MTTTLANRDAWFQARYAQLTMLWCALALLLAVASLVAKIAGLADGPAIPLQMLLLAIGVALFGVPHGGLDHVVAARVLAMRGAQNTLTRQAVFFVGYSLLALVVLLAWWWTPVVMLLLFLVASALHFALRDGALESNAVDASGLRLVHQFALGAAPIVVPWLMYPGEVGLVFGWLSDTSPEIWQPPWTAAVSYAVVAALTAIALLTAPAGNTRRRWEVAGTVAIFVLLPPLIAFAWYFCFLHSLRHLLTLAHRLVPDGQRAALQWVAVRSLPLTIMTVVLAVIGYLYLGGAADANGMSLAKVIFWGLAALTFPHMLLTAAWEHLQSRMTVPADVVASGNHRVVRADELK